MSPHLLYPACLIGGIAITALSVLLVRAVRHANRVIREAPVRSNVVPLDRRNGVRVIPQRDGRAS